MDWQSYLDGTMEPAERAALEARLESEPPLRADLEGFQAFVASIQSAHANERIPEVRLEAMLEGVVRPAVRRERRFLPVWGPRIAVAATLGIVLYMGTLSTLRDPVAPASSPEREMRMVSQPALAASFVRERTGYPAAAISLASASARLECSRVGNEWACYEYIIDGRKVVLMMTTSDRFDRGTPCINCDGVQTYRGTTGIGWRYDGIAYYLRGADMDKLRTYARAAVNELKAAGSTQY